MGASFGGMSLASSVGKKIILPGGGPVYNYSTNPALANLMHLMAWHREIATINDIYPTPFPTRAYASFGMGLAEAVTPVEPTVQASLRYLTDYSMPDALWKNYPDYAFSRISDHFFNILEDRLQNKGLYDQDEIDLFKLALSGSGDESREEILLDGNQLIFREGVDLIRELRDMGADEPFLQISFDTMLARSNQYLDVYQLQPMPPAEVGTYGFFVHFALKVRESVVKQDVKSKSFDAVRGELVDLLESDQKISLEISGLGVVSDTNFTLNIICDEFLNKAKYSDNQVTSYKEAVYLVENFDDFQHGTHYNINSLIDAKSSILYSKSFLNDLVPEGTLPEDGRIFLETKKAEIDGYVNFLLDKVETMRGSYAEVDRVFNDYDYTELEQPFYYAEDNGMLL